MAKKKAEKEPPALDLVEPRQTVEGLARMAVARRDAGLDLTEEEALAMEEFPEPRLAVEEPPGPAFASRPGKCARDRRQVVRQGDRHEIPADARIIPTDDGWVCTGCAG